MLVVFKKYSIIEIVEDGYITGPIEYIGNRAVLHEPEWYRTWIGFIFNGNKKEQRIDLCLIAEKIPARIEITGSIPIVIQTERLTSEVVEVFPEFFFSEPLQELLFFAERHNDTWVVRRSKHANRCITIVHVMSHR